MPSRHVVRGYAPEQLAAPAEEDRDEEEEENIAGTQSIAITLAPTPLSS